MRIKRAIISQSHQFPSRESSKVKKENGKEVIGFGDQRSLGTFKKAPSVGRLGGSIG